MNAPKITQSSVLISDALNFPLSKSFCAFKSKLNFKSYLIYVSLNSHYYEDESEQSRDLTVYSLDKEKAVQKMKKAHNYSILVCRYCYNGYKRKEYVMTCSHDEDVKIWNVNNVDVNNDDGVILTEFVHLTDIYKYKNITACCTYFTREDEFIIVTSENKASVKIFDFDKNLILVDRADCCVEIVDVFYDLKNKRNYVCYGEFHPNQIRVCDITYNYSLYRIFSEESDNQITFDIKVRRLSNRSGNGDDIELIESVVYNKDGWIRIWNFTSGDLVRKITLKFPIRGIEIISDGFICAGESSYERNKGVAIYVIDVDTGEIVESLKEHKYYISTLIKLSEVDNYGDMLVSLGGDRKIVVWKCVK